MFKNLLNSKFLLTGLLLAGMSLFSFGQTSTIPDIDGDGSDAAWDIATAWDITGVIYDADIVDANDLSGTVKVIWSADSLYILSEVLDDSLYSGTGSSYLYDNICIYIDAFNQATSSYVDETQMYWEKNWWQDDSSVGGRLGTNWASPADMAHFATHVVAGTGYTIEMAVAWDKLGKTPVAGDVMGFDVKLSDNDGGDGEPRDQLAWRDETDGGWDNPSLWGEITLNADGTVSGQKAFDITVDGNAGDRAWAPIAAWPVASVINDDNITNASDLSGTVKLFWTADSLYILSQVVDDILYSGTGSAYLYDNICIYLDVFNKATSTYVDTTQIYWEKNWWDNNMGGRYGPNWASPAGVGNYAFTAVDGSGYAIELAVGWNEIDKTPVVGDVMGFDVKISDNDGGDGEPRNQLAWRDVTDTGWDNPSVWGEITLEADGKVSGQKVFTPVVDGVANERAWATMPTVELQSVISDEGLTGDADLSGRFKLNWTADSLYVYVDVDDDSLYSGTGSAYLYDNICIYIDAFNQKTTSYTDDTQMYWEKNWWDDGMGGRLGTNWMAPSNDFAVTVNAGSGYVIELAYAWAQADKTPVVGDVVGFDVKLSDNDGGDGEIRDQITYMDISDGGWDNPSLWGDIELDADGYVSTLNDRYGAPADLVASVDGPNVTLSWTANEAMGSYNIYRNNTLVAEGIADGAYTEAVDADGVYTYAVRGIDADGYLSIASKVSAEVAGGNAVNDFSGQMKVYPNPVVDVLNISGTTNIKTVKVMNYAGQVVKKLNLHSSNAKLDVSNLQAGMYVVAVETDSATLNYKVMIQ